MAILQCPCCGSTDIKSDKKKTTFTCGSIGAIAGGIAFGPLGLITGSLLGGKLGSNHEKLADKAGREFNWFECKSCGEPFIICPECRNTVDLDHMIKYGELPLKSGYEVVQGSMCAYCHNIFYSPFYK